VVRLPVHLHELMGKVMRADAEFEAAHCAKPSRAQLAALTGVAQEKLALLSKARNFQLYIATPSPCLRLLCTMHALLSKARASLMHHSSPMPAPAVHRASAAAFWRSPASMCAPADACCAVWAYALCRAACSHDMLPWSALV
jgi:hypothetical protein